MTRRPLRALPVAAAALVLVSTASAGIRLQSVDTSGFPRVRATVVVPLGAPAADPDGERSPRGGILGRQPRPGEGARARARPVAVDARQAARGRRRGRAVARRLRTGPRPRRRRRVRPGRDRAHQRRHRTLGRSRRPRRPCRRRQERHRALRLDRPCRRAALERPAAGPRARRRHRRTGRLQLAHARTGRPGRPCGPRRGLCDRDRRAGLHARHAPGTCARNGWLVPAGTEPEGSRRPLFLARTRAGAHVAALVRHRRPARRDDRPGRDRPRRGHRPLRADRRPATARRRPPRPC